MKKIIGILQGKRVSGNEGSTRQTSEPAAKATMAGSKSNDQGQKIPDRLQPSAWPELPTQDIFHDSFVTTNKNLRLILVALPLSVLIHLTAVALVIGVPLMSPGSLPPVQVYSAFLAPMPSPAPPPPPPRGNGRSGTGKKTPVQKQQVVETGKLLVPISIPEEIAAEELVGDGVEGGVPWGVDYGDEKPVWNETIQQLVSVTTEKEEEPVKAIGEVRLPKLLRRVEPDYPQAAQAARIEGVVTLEATTDIYGRVQSVRVIHSVPLLDQAAIEAVSQWVYEPMVINGRPRSVTFTVNITFKLQK